MEINITIKLTEKESDEFFNKLMGIIEDEPNDKPERVECSIYAKWFNDSCAGWTNDAENNKTFLKYQESYMNEKLRSQGYLFLNDVYRSLGMEQTKAGQVVGWIFDEKNIMGDNYVSFGIFEEVNMDFVNGECPNALLDFNVDGNILDLI